jgi:hypothetical protein
MKRKVDSENLNRAWDLGREEMERFYGGAGRCVVAMDADERLLAVLYFKRYGTEAALWASVARMRGDFPGATWREGAMACGQFWQGEAAHWPERENGQHHHEEPGREHERGR